MKKPLLILLIFISLTIIAKAQDFDYGTFKLEDLEMKRYDKDTSAHAVVLNEYGRSKIDVTSNDNIKIIYEYHVKIKIFDSKGFDHANVEVILRDNDEDSETIENIKGITTYADDNGSISKTELEPEKVYKSKMDKYHTLVKFALPSIRNGCIIEYKYTTYSRYLQLFPHWEFQSDIPKMHSEYDVHIPGFWNYNASLRGSLKLTTNKAEIESNCFSAGGGKSDCSHLTFGMTDIPAFIDEDDMTSRKNFLSAVYFELAEYTNPYNGAKTKMAKEWRDVDYDLKHSEYFGSLLKKKDLFKDRIIPVIAGKTDSMARAKAVYEYIQKTLKWNDFYATGSNDGLRKVLETHSGNVAEINLALAAALEAAGFNAQAVLLSTRENGFINKLYPVQEEFNYVVAKVDIDNKPYLLDATDPLLPFGILPMKCLNDQGRVMSLDKPSYWIDMNSTQQRIIRTSALDLTLQPDGKLKGTMVQYLFGYAAYEERKAIKKFNSVDEYVENLDERSPKFKILNSEISNLDSLDMPLVEKYEIEIKKYDDLYKDRLVFNPYITDHITRNPYRLQERNYPIDRGMPLTERFTLVVHLPDNYIVDTPPQDISIGLPNKGGLFETLYQASDNSFTFSHIIQFNKAIYSSEEYAYLKELFNKIILSEKAPMTLKKKS
ncbi:Transglutaminase-like superfamily protein [Mucilaginibacter mallensis]|uniref:Transglutaminase-like superfamily protein n=1 Tax=Mucilaginibacter mallensis TaxID=652787 RepID=A0A1H1V9D0_MUCMA|nr:transglutaminase domain-containing protein [Mucilaginibacter mallensis]SDS81352.1 Transglutaminase-like superfamily protein [Mucilaginibacter mallensis]